MEGNSIKGHGFDAELTFLSNHESKRKDMMLCGLTLKLLSYAITDLGHNRDPI